MQTNTHPYVARRSRTHHRCKSDTILYIAARDEDIHRVWGQSKTRPLCYFTYQQKIQNIRSKISRGDQREVQISEGQLR